MRLHAVAATLLVLAGCAHPARSPVAPSAGPSANHVDPAGVRHIRRDLPPGYEVAPLVERYAPNRFWGLGPASTSTPERCALLADPAAGHGQRPQGVSASGAGGTVYAVVVAVPGGSVGLDRALAAQCRQWSMTDRQAEARVQIVDAPHIDAADSVGMAVTISTSVEGGGEIVSQATTFTAYLGDYYASTTLVNDPGSPRPPLPPQFAADLLVKTVSAVRR